jgi:hypothetical protein
MITIQLDDKTIQVQEELNLDKFMKIHKNPIKYNNIMDLVSLYLDVDKEELYDVPMEQMKFVESILSTNMFSDGDNKIILTFEIDGVEYGFENNWKDIKWGQWVDMEIFSQSDKIYDSIHILMALLYRPVKSKKGDKYTLVPFKSAEVMERAEIFLTKVPARYWFGCANFFFQISNQYITSTKHSLELTIKTNKMLWKMTRHLPKWLRPKQLPVSTLN